MLKIRFPECILLTNLTKMFVTIAIFLSNQDLYYNSLSVIPNFDFESSAKSDRIKDSLLFRLKDNPSVIQSLCGIIPFSTMDLNKCFSLLKRERERTKDCFRWIV